jgi:hypothetical protein
MSAPQRQGSTGGELCTFCLCDPSLQHHHKHQTMKKSLISQPVVRQRKPWGFAMLHVIHGALAEWRAGCDAHLVKYAASDGLYSEIT